MFVRGSIEEDNGEDIQVPHAVDPCEKGAVDLESVVSQVPVTFTDLLKNKIPISPNNKNISRVDLLRADTYLI